MRHANQLRAMLFNVVVENTIMSLLASIVCSVLLSYWISGRLRLINRTCNTVMAGNLEERAPTSGGRDEFDQLASNFNAMLSWITQLIHSIKDTTNALAHDMRTPLGAVITSLDLLMAAGGMNAEQREMFAIAQKGGEELLEMLNSMLEVNRLQSGEHALSRESFHVSALLRHVFQLAKPLADEAWHDLSVVYPVDDVLLTADQTLLARVLLNLVSNAVKFCPRGSAIVLRAEKNPAVSGGGCRFIVSDNGPGVPDEEKALIFEKYQQGTARSGDASFGLGLRFCTLTVEAHGGSIVVSDAPGGGSEFSFVIPDRRSAAAG
jgi:signal transduction histidine kinase